MPRMRALIGPGSVGHAAMIWARLDAEGLANIRHNFNQAAGWAVGDINGSLLVDAADLAIVRNRFGKSFHPSPTPEPATLGWLVMGSLLGREPL